MFAGTVTTGGVVSACGVTVTVNDADDVFPVASDAVHVTVVVPSGNVEPDAGEQENDVTPTASFAVAVYVTTVAVDDDTVMSAGTVIAGAVVSATVTMNDAV